MINLRLLRLSLIALLLLALLLATGCARHVTYPPMLIPVSPDFKEPDLLFWAFALWLTAFAYAASLV